MGQRKQTQEMYTESIRSPSTCVRCCSGMLFPGLTHSPRQLPKPPIETDSLYSLSLTAQSSVHKLLARSTGVGAGGALSARHGVDRGKGRHVLEERHPPGREPSMCVGCPRIYLFCLFPPRKWTAGCVLKCQRFKQSE